MEDERGLAGRVEYPPMPGKGEGCFSITTGLSVNGIDSEAFYNYANTRNRDSDRGIDSFITVKKAGEDLKSSIS